MSTTAIVPEVARVAEFASTKPTTELAHSLGITVAEAADRQQGTGWTLYEFLLMCDQCEGGAAQVMGTAS